MRGGEELYRSTLNYVVSQADMGGWRIQRIGGRIKRAGSCNWWRFIQEIFFLYAGPFGTANCVGDDS